MEKGVGNLSILFYSKPISFILESYYPNKHM